MLEVVTILFPKEYERGDASPRKRDFLYGELYRCSNDIENIQSYLTVEKEENVLEKEIRKENGKEDEEEEEEEEEKEVKEAQKEEKEVEEGSIASQVETRIAS
ncbi:hypothetical protein V1477_011354 [Vespula maculifrons]|uniref:Uncharacterized protein n=1 Tax=Vespula maculifrons TaxID=7453 RepID=A0ABD2C4J7_VESMC